MLDNGGCEDRCVNLEGGFRCECRGDLFQLAQDQRSCVTSCPKGYTKSEEHHVRRHCCFVHTQKMCINFNHVHVHYTINAFFLVVLQSLPKTTRHKIAKRCSMGPNFPKLKQTCHFKCHVSLCCCCTVVSGGTRTVSFGQPRDD